MKPITDRTQTASYGRLVREMMIAETGRECEFDSNWIRRCGWKVVPVESAMRLPDEHIPSLVSALKEAGYSEILAVFNEPGYIQQLPLVVAIEPQGSMPTCYKLNVEDLELREFNRELGPFRSVLTPEDRSWAISCAEWYNLFGAKPKLLEDLLGRPIAQARQEFFDYASLLARGQNPDESALQVANRYATL